MNPHNDDSTTTDVLDISTVGASIMSITISW